MEEVFIFVLDRGFVVVGTRQIHPTLAYHWLVRGRTIRRWGTTQGLSELCGGPTTDTQLDPICDREIPWRSVIEMQIAEAKKWAKSLK